MPTSPKSFHPQPLASLQGVAFQDEPGASAGRLRAFHLGAVGANLAAALFWLGLVIYAAWSIATETETRYGMLLLTIVVAGRIYTTWRLGRRSAPVVYWSIGSNVVALLVMLLLVALGEVEVVLVFPIELAAAALTYLARDAMA